VATFSQRIVLLKVIGWSLRILAALLVIVMAVSFITALPNIAQTSPNASSNLATLIQADLFLLLGLCVVTIISTYIFSVAKHQEEDLDSKLLGYVISNYSTNLAAIATWLNLTQKEVADRLAKLASKGQVYGVNIDLTNGTISRGTLPVEQASSRNQASPASMASVPNTMVQPASVPSESDEVIKIKAKLYELEVLKQQGKIGTPAYNKLKEEYETKLAQIDTGTKVY
jgi:hypothetical protein